MIKQPPYGSFMERLYHTGQVRNKGKKQTAEKGCKENADEIQ